MIPKTIHYVWLGDNPMPDRVKRCRESWLRLMPDYKIRLWGEPDISCIGSLFLQESVKEGMWAFASDVVRMYALYNHGGIYLDTDVMVHKRFDALLDNPAFCGRENSMHLVGGHTMNYLTTCCMGAEKGNAFIRRCLDYYKGRHFVTSEDRSLPSGLRLDLRLNSEIMCFLAKEIGYYPGVLSDSIQYCSNMLTVYPKDFFDPQGLTENSYCHHLALGSWRDVPITRYYDYTLAYKLQWRIWAALDKILKHFNRKIIRLE